MPVLSKINLVIKQGEFVGEFNVRVVESSNVESIAWPTSGEPLMIVRYKDGGVYGYLGVSRQRCVAAANAPSVGRYIHRRIKGKFKPVKLSG